jgi:fructosamine-3-kinase
MRVKDIIKSFPDGVSFQRVKNTWKVESKKNGFFVALTDNEVKNKEQNEIKRLEAMAKELQLTRYYFGYWKDEKTGKGYLDLSIWTESKDEAITIGKVFNQKAIFDCGALDSVYL